MSNRTINRLLLAVLIANLVWLVFELSPGLFNWLRETAIGLLDVTQWSQLSWLTFFSLLFAGALAAKIYPDLKQWITKPPAAKRSRRNKSFKSPPPKLQQKKNKLSPRLKQQLDDQRRRGY